MTTHDPSLQELANLDFALKAIAARRDETIRLIAARRRRGDQSAMSKITGLHRETIAAISQRPAQRA